PVGYGVLQHRGGGALAWALVCSGSATGALRVAGSWYATVRVALPLTEPFRKSFPMELRKVAVLVDAGHRLQQRAVHGELVHPVRQRRREASELPDEVRVAEHPVLKCHAGRAGIGRARAQQQAREVDGPAMRRGIGAVVVTEFALVTEIDDFLDVRGRQLLDVAIDGVDVDPIEQDLE